MFFYKNITINKNIFDNKIDDNEREGLFMRTFKEIPVIINKGFQKIKNILDDINAPKIQRDEVEFHPVVVNDVYDVMLGVLIITNPPILVTLLISTIAYMGSTGKCSKTSKNMTRSN